MRELALYANLITCVYVCMTIRILTYYIHLTFNHAHVRRMGSLTGSVYLNEYEHEHVVTRHSITFNIAGCRPVPTFFLLQEDRTISVRTAKNKDDSKEGRKDWATVKMV